MRLEPEKGPVFSCSWISVASPFAHVGMTEHQMHLHPRRNDERMHSPLPRDGAWLHQHRCRWLQRYVASRPIRMASCRAVAARDLRGGSRRPWSIFRPMDERNGCQCGALRAVRPNSTRQRNTMLVAMPMATADLRHGGAGLLRLLHDRPLLLVAEAAPVRSPIHRVRREAAFASRAISSGA